MQVIGLVLLTTEKKKKLIKKTRDSYTIMFQKELKWRQQSQQLFLELD